MYKKLSLIFSSILISSFAFSQISYGIKAGVTESFLQDKIGSTNQNYNLRTGYQAGLFAEIPLSGNLSVRPALQITQKGFKKVEGTPGSAFYWKRNFLTNYLELPLDAVYNFHLTRKPKYKLEQALYLELDYLEKIKPLSQVLILPNKHTRNIW